MMDIALVIVFLFGLIGMLVGLANNFKTLRCVGLSLLITSIILTLIWIHVITITPTAMDVYKGKTEMSYTIVMNGDSIEYKDSCVIFKK